MPPIPVTKGPSSTATLPTCYQVSLALLSYVPKGQGLDPLQDESWTTLQSVGGPKDANVGPVIFDYSVRITQKTKGASATLRFDPSQYANPVVRPGKTNTDPIKVDIQCKGGYHLSLEGEDKDKAGPELPLVKMCSSFAYLRLAIVTRKMKNVGGTYSGNVKVVAGHLKALLTGHDRLDIQNRWYAILNDDHSALFAESEAQEAQLGLFKNCRIKTRAGGKLSQNVVVEVYPAKPADEDDEDALHFDQSRRVGLSYWIKAPGLFPTDDVTLSAHKILSQPRTEGWELIVTKTPEDSPAAIVGTIANSFASEGVANFIDKEESDVSLEPIFNDVQGSRTRTAVGQYGRTLDEETRRAHGFFVSEEAQKRPKTSLPVNTFFGGYNCDDTENTLDRGNSQLSADIAATLNEVQRKAGNMSLGSKISVVQGPPGTGKSTLSAALNRHLIVNARELIINTAMTHVAVDALLEACIKMWRKFAFDGDLPFARFYTETQILSQWAMDDHATLDNSCHIDQLRFRQAQKDPEAWSDYLGGRAQFKETGMISDEDSYKAYAKQARMLTRQLLGGTIRAIFSTVGSCQSSMLYEEDPKGGIQWFFKATTILNDEAGTTQRRHVMMMVMAYPAACRLILVGDPKQLPALVLSAKAKKIWPRSYLQTVVDRKWPCEILKIQYRMYAELYAHTAACIYKTEISSIKLINQPSAFLQRLLAQPVRVDTKHNTYHLQSFLHFLDVPHGFKQSHEGGSSWNRAEVEVVDGLVKGLLEAGVEKDDICVMTGYTAQLKLLGQVAKENNWIDVKRILTIDSSQGSEYKVVILTLVTTTGMPGFMGFTSRANVGTSRQQEALYFVGQAKYWFAMPKSSKRTMHTILRFMSETAKKNNRPAFVVESQQHASAQEVMMTHVVSEAVNSPSPVPAPEPLTPSLTSGPESSERVAEKLAALEEKLAQMELAKESTLQNLVEEEKKAHEKVAAEYAQQRQDLIRDREDGLAQLKAEVASLKGKARE